MIDIQGDGLEGAQIVWDAGTSTERVIPGGFLGAFMFSVPDGVAPGTMHNVALQNDAGRSASMTFSVPSTPGSHTEARPPGDRVFPEPRIDAVTVIGAAFGSSGANVLLYVQGANIDVGATVWVKNTAADPLVEVATASHKVLRNDWLGVSSEEFGYPIYHYSSTIVYPGIRPAGQELLIVVKNLGGLESKEFPYQLPADSDSIDSDGDGLLDTWETDGYDVNNDGTTDINLKAMGADPYRRDIFLELDIMEGLHFPPHLEGGMPDSTVFDGVKAMFNSAPIINLAGPPGIHLEIDAMGKPCVPAPPGPEKCSFEFTMFDTSSTSGLLPNPFVSNMTKFSELKKHSFDKTLRGNVYHYAIWGISDNNGSTGNSASGHSDFADDLLISMDGFNPLYQTRRSQIEILAHELGHNLGQRHGGNNDLLYKPNYLSVMSYSWALRTGWGDSDDRLAFVTCLPFYYATKGAQEVGGDVPSDVSTIVDYSEGMAQTLMRPTSTGASTFFCGLRVDWTTISNVVTVTESDDFANWRALKFDGPIRNGWIP